MIRTHGDSVVYLPPARLTTKQLGKASGHLGVIASEEGRSVAEVRLQAEQAVREGPGRARRARPVRRGASQTLESADHADGCAVLT